MVITGSATAKRVIVNLTLIRITMQKKHSKKIGVALLVILGGGGLYLLYRWVQSSRMNALSKSPDSIKQSQASQPVKASTPSIFPLKLGSPKNDLVKQLQAYLGVDADGIWGPKTQAAFTVATGKTQITSQADYDATIAKLQNTKAIASNNVRGDDLMQKWTTNTSLQLATIDKVTLTGVVKDAYGALNPNNKYTTIGSNYKLNRTDYTPLGITTKGFLLLQINTGAFAGLYTADVNKFTVA